MTKKKLFAKKKSNEKVVGGVSKRRKRVWAGSLMKRVANWTLMTKNSGGGGGPAKMSTGVSGTQTLSDSGLSSNLAGLGSQLVSLGSQLAGLGSQLAGLGSQLVESSVQGAGLVADSGVSQLAGLGSQLAGLGSHLVESSVQGAGLVVDSGVSSAGLVSGSGGLDDGGILFLGLSFPHAYYHLVSKKREEEELFVKKGEKYDLKFHHLMRYPERPEDEYDYIVDSAFLQEMQSCNDILGPWFVKKSAIFTADAENTLEYMINLYHNHGWQHGWSKIKFFEECRKLYDKSSCEGFVDYLHTEVKKSRRMYSSPIAGCVSIPLQVFRSITVNSSLVCLIELECA